MLVERETVNLELLDAALRATLGAVYLGASAGPRGVRVHLSEDASAAQCDQARQLVVDHDATGQTPAQLERQRRRVLLAAYRQEHVGDELDPGDYATQPAIVRRLARKLAWLEQEIRQLREG